VEVLANDTDPEVDPLTIVPASWTQGANGAVSCTATSCTYTPAPNFFGSDSFTYEATDGELFDAAAVTMTISPVNDAPVPGTVSVRVTDGESITFDVLADASDIDGDALHVPSNTQPSHGSATCADDGTCTYTPESGHSGTDSFTYTISDAGVPPATAQGTARIRVLAVRTPTCVGRPATMVGTARDDVLTGTAGRDVIVAGRGNDTISGLGGNDRLCAQAGNDTIRGGAGDDTIGGGAGTDMIGGNPGNDIIRGRDQADTLFGHAGVDLLLGGAGGDVMRGGTGDDTVRGREGNDTIRGGPGDDRLRGAAGKDHCRGGTGTDTANTCEIVSGIP
jgi:Ca2+-binding RTX toxin-like protein